MLVFLKDTTMNNVIRGKKEVDNIEKMLNELVYEYDMFFRGYEKIEPTRKRDQVKRELLKLQTLRINNSIIKQKSANLTHRFATYQRKWVQIWLQIENGKYKIDKYKMNRNRKLAGKEELEKGKSKTVDTAPKEKDYNKLLSKYEVTQQLLGVNKKLNRELIRKKLKEQEEILKKKYKVKGIDFKVIVKNGKATIKPIPIK